MQKKRKRRIQWIIPCQRDSCSLWPNDEKFKFWDTLGGEPKKNGVKVTWIETVNDKLSLTATWLPHGQLWAIIEETASLTRF